MERIIRDINLRLSEEAHGIWVKIHGKESLLRFKDCCADGSKCVGSRDITQMYLIFSSDPPIKIVFHRGFLAYLRTGKTAVQRFHALERFIRRMGYTTFDLS